MRTTITELLLERKGEISKSYFHALAAALGVKSFVDLSRDDLIKGYDHYRSIVEMSGGKPLKLWEYLRTFEYLKIKETGSWGNLDEIIKSPAEVIAEGKKLEWVLYPFFAKDFYSILFGPPGQLKTVTALDLAINLSRGEACFGKYLPEKSYRVLFLEWDFPTTLLKERLQLLNKPMDDNRLGFIDFFDLEAKFGQEIDLAESEGRTCLFEIIKQSGAEFVILDSLSSFHTGDEARGRQMKPILTFLRSVASGLHIHLMILFHPRKRVAGERRSSLDQDDISDPGLLSRWASLAMAIRKQKENTYILSLVKTWFKEVPEIRILVDTSKGGISLHYSYIEDDDLKPKDKFSFAKSWILKNGTPLTRKEIIEALDALDISPRTVDRALKDLKDQGKISIQNGLVVKIVKQEETIWI